MSALGLLSLGCALLVNNVAGFYLPEAAPCDHQPGENVDLLVNALTQILANEEHAKLVCSRARSTLVAVLTARRNPSLTVRARNLRRFAPLTVLLPVRSISVSQKAARRHNRSDLGPSSPAIGYSIPPPPEVGPLLLSPMTWLTFTKIKILEDGGVCKKLCTVTDIPPEDSEFINERVREDYALNWLVDGFPAAEKKIDNKTGNVFYDTGFNLWVDDGEFYANPALNNYHEILLEYHTPVSGTHRVVGAVVWPSRLVFTRSQFESTPHVTPQSRRRTDRRCEPRFARSSIAPEPGRSKHCDIHI